MEIEYGWCTPMSAEFLDGLKSAIRKDIEDDPDISPCHTGSLKVRLSSTGPLQDSVNGEVECQCGHTLATFSGSSDGSKLTWKLKG
ncbi:hypothetical protein [Nitrospira tepida]|uniref:hypothetical protein n=1 Tax=Nitrospira tepida TaxID=2973512 RepID=UPI00259C9660|nr:hypothetical protein [Nitrospira tepida]